MDKKRAPQSKKGGPVKKDFEDLEQNILNPKTKEKDPSLMQRKNTGKSKMPINKFDYEKTEMTLLEGDYNKLDKLNDQSPQEEVPKVLMPPKIELKNLSIFELPEVIKDYKLTQIDRLNTVLINDFLEIFFIN